MYDSDIRVSIENFIVCARVARYLISCFLFIRKKTLKFLDELFKLFFLDL